MNLVELNNVSFRWKSGGNKNQGNAFHLQCAKFDIRARQSVFLQGASGSGKSTLLGLICGTIRAQQGEVMLAGNNLGLMSGAEIDRLRADLTGIIFQSFNLVPYLNALENILLPLQFSNRKKLQAGSSNIERREKALHLLECLGFEVVRDGLSLPQNLSVGQQQRVAAARALIGNPALIIADEPTSALDETNQDRFLELLLAQLKDAGASLLMVSHNQRLAPLFSYKASLEDGVLRAGRT